MKPRRCLLFLAFLGLWGTALVPARAALADVTAEGAAYGGTTAGGWTCGPAARANYGGIAGGVRTTERRAGPETSEGGVFSARASFERESLELIRAACTEGECSEALPPDSSQGGGSVRGGYQWLYGGFEAGVVALTGFKRPTDSRPDLLVLPSLEGSFGPRDEVYGVVGFGNPTLTMQRRSAILYAGSSILLDNEVWLRIHLSLARSGPALFDEVGPRLDLALRLPVAASMSAEFGGAFSTGDSGEGGELSLALQWAL